MLLLRVEVWRDLRARMRPDDRRLTRSEALAEIAVADLRRSDPVKADRLNAAVQRQFKDEGCSPRRALVKAVSYELAKDAKDVPTRDSTQPFESLQSLLSQALRRYGPSDALIADVRRRQARRARRLAGLPSSGPSSKCSSASAI